LSSPSRRLPDTWGYACDGKWRCILARQNLHLLEMQRPVYYIDERGERVYLDDQVRAAEMEWMRAEIAEYCD
jgi:hypothetical protein